MKRFSPSLACRLAAAVLAVAPLALAAQDASMSATPADPSAISPYFSRAIPARLVNLGVRSTLAANETLISGFYITEATAATVLVRAVGPTLAGFGVTGAMANPKLQIFNSEGRVVAANDDWSPTVPPGGPENPAWSVPQAGQMVGAFPLPAASRDAAIVATLKPGAYTLVISGSSSADTGVVLGEIYHLPTAETPATAAANGLRPASKLSNLSVRGRIAAGGNADPVMIGSFVIGGSSVTVSAAPSAAPLPEAPSKRFLIRAVGPSLAPYGVTDALSDPTLELKGNNGLAIRMNDNWDADPESGRLIREAAASVGAFPLEAGSRDAVGIVRLPEGAYSVIARGANGATGTVLIEIYELAD